MTSGALPPLSVPVAARAPRTLTADEVSTLCSVADALVPDSGPGKPAATSEAGFTDALAVAVNARADAFTALVAVLARWRDASSLDTELRALHRDDPSTFQALSAVVVGGWLLLPAVRERIGYPGQPRDVAPFDQIADELLTGVLEPVVERGPIFTPAPPD